VEVPLDGLIAQGSEPTPPEPVYGPGHWRMPGGFYQGMILPLSPLSIRGVIWYQGEGNSREAQQYETSFPMLIADWRERFRNPQMPFYFVQLANYQVPDETLTRPVFAELREAQRKTSRRVPNVGMAVAIDLGVSDDIHPKDKQSVAQRLARLALSGTYGRVMPAATGPLPIAACREGSGVVVSFHEVAAGLRPRGEALEGFELAGPDGVFHAAVAELAGPDRIRLLADAVAAPMQARYAFANDPRHVLLENTEGLAASPFVLEVTGP
jgi:sialate O-acetylesterase